MYKVIVRFQDLQDGHIYEVGDTFPHNGIEVKADRIKELAGSGNKLGKAIIEEVKEDVDNHDGDVSRTEKLVRPKPDKVSRKVRDK